MIRSLFMIHLNNVIAAEGALPIRVGDDVIGAVGVSGSPGGERTPFAPGGDR